MTNRKQRKMDESQERRMIGAAWDALFDVMRFSDNEHLRAHIAMGVINFHDRKYAAQRQEEVKALNEAYNQTAKGTQ